VGGDAQVRRGVGVVGAGGGRRGAPERGEGSEAGRERPGDVVAGEVEVLERRELGKLGGERAEQRVVA